MYIEDLRLIICDMCREFEIKIVELRDYGCFGIRESHTILSKQWSIPAVTMRSVKLKPNEREILLQAKNVVWNVAFFNRMTRILHRRSKQ